MNWNTASTAILRLELIRHFSQYRPQEAQQRCASTVIINSPF